MTDRDKELQQSLDSSSDRISTEVRQISLGLLAIVWAFLVGKVALELPGGMRSMFLVSFLAILTMTADFLQYVAGYWSAAKARKELKAGGSGTFRRSWWSYRLRFGCFYIKIVLCLANSAFFLVLVGLAAFKD